ncbi:MAG: hypothetical protein QOI10_668 [Solirubrobacterales bacterium]|nr:hypothetical protein [Solirubrobacterales bacterium]
MEDATGDARGRILIAIAAAIGLTAVIVVVAISSGGGSEQRSVAAPERCVDAWNADQAALAYGRHNFSFHLYTGALVTFLTEAGDEVGAGEGGLCAVVFPSRALDPEPFAAGQVLQQRSWAPISSLPLIQLARVAELQVLAAGSPNTTLDARGKLTAL